MWTVDLADHCEFTSVVLRVHTARFTWEVSVRLFGKEQILGNGVHVLTRNSRD